MLNLKFTAIKFFIAAVVFIAVVILITCSKPFEPVPQKDYIFYALNAAVAPSPYLAYHTLTGILDTFYLAVEPAGGVLDASPFAVTPDGKFLYVAATSNISLVDLKTKQVVRTVPLDSKEVQVSPDGGHIAVHGWRHQLTIMETENYTPVYFDSSISEGSFTVGRFSQSGESYYYGDDTDSGTAVYKIDFMADSIPQIKKFPQKSLGGVIASPDEMRWYLYLHLGGFIFEFAVYDVVSDSIIFSEIFLPGSGFLEMTPDGRYVFYTYPGGMIGPPPSRMSLTVFDTYKNEIAKVIPGGFVESAGDTVPFSPGELAITPDGQKLIAVAASSGGRFIVIDVRKLEVERYVFVGNDVAVTFLTIQGKP